MKIHHYRGWQLWYDRGVRCWYAARFDAAGFQIGSAIDAYTRGEVESEVDRLSGEEVPHAEA